MDALKKVTPITQPLPIATIATKTSVATLPFHKGKVGLVFKRRGKKIEDHKKPFDSLNVADVYLCGHIKSDNEPQCIPFNELSDVRLDHDLGRTFPYDRYKTSEFLEYHDSNGNHHTSFLRLVSITPKERNLSKPNDDIALAFISYKAFKQFIARDPEACNFKEEIDLIEKAFKIENRISAILLRPFKNFFTDLHTKYFL